MLLPVAWKRMVLEKRGDPSCKEAVDEATKQCVSVGDALEETRTGAQCTVLQLFGVYKAEEAYVTTVC